LILLKSGASGFQVKFQPPESSARGHGHQQHHAKQRQQHEQHLSAQRRQALQHQHGLRQQLGVKAQAGGQQLTGRCGGQRRHHRHQGPRRCANGTKVTQVARRTRRLAILTRLLDLAVGSGKLAVLAGVGHVGAPNAPLSADPGNDNGAPSSGSPAMVPAAALAGSSRIKRRRSPPYYRG